MNNESNKVNYHGQVEILNSLDVIGATGRISESEEDGVRTITYDLRPAPTFSCLIEGLSPYNERT